MKCDLSFLGTSGSGSRGDLGKTIHGLAVLFVLVASLVSLDAQGKGKGHNKKGPPVPPPPPPSSSAWRLEFSPRTTLLDTPDGPAFTFPGTGGSANMLTMGWPGTSVGRSLVITLRVETTGAPIFNLAQGPEPTCTSPPAARPYFSTDNPFDTRDPLYLYNRWWSRYTFVALGPGETTITVPIDPSRWGNVNGQLGNSTPTHETWFAHAAGIGGRLGLVFGGGCSYGHGIYTSGGTARLTVLDYHVE